MGAAINNGLRHIAHHLRVLSSQATLPFGRPSSDRVGSLQSEISELRRGYDGYKGAYETLQQEASELRRGYDGYKGAFEALTGEVARLRDERDRQKIALEVATAKSRRDGFNRGFAGKPGAEPAGDALNDGTNSLPRGQLLRAELREQSEIGDGPTASRSPLRLICVGAGRDGTTSVSQLVQYAFDSRGLGEVVVHEWGSAEFNTAFCNLVETNDSRYEQQIRAALVGCPIAAIAGNGYAAILPIIADLFGSRAILIHIRRRDRSACIASLAQNADLYPVEYKYYSDSHAAIGKRMAAFHFGEMSRLQWDGLTLINKLGWYYDKTHSLVEEHKHRFVRTLEVETESLSAESFRYALAEAVGAERPPPSVHLNRHFEFGAASLRQRMFGQRLLGKLDVERLARDDLYGLGHFLREYVHHFSSLETETGGETLDKLRWTVSEARVLLENRMADLRELEARLNGGGTSDPRPRS